MPFAVPSMAGNRGDGCRNEKGWNQQRFHPLVREFKFLISFHHQICCEWVRKKESKFNSFESIFDDGKEPSGLPNHVTRLVR